MMIQEWIYLGLVLYGVVALIITILFAWMWIEEKLLNKKTDFETRLHRGEILSKENIF
jgi:preprotein translocase subunit SecY